MTDRGLIYANRPSIRALARAAKIASSETVRQMIYGESRPDPETVTAVAEVLGPQVHDWVEEKRPGRSWSAPPEAVLLTDDEGQALTRLIRLMTLDRRGRSSQERDSKSARHISLVQFPDADIYDNKIADEDGEAAGADTTDSDG